MENNLSKLDKLMKLSIIAGIFIIASSLAYYLVIFIPQKEEERIRGQEQEQATENLNKEREELKQKQEKCLNNAKDIRDRMEKDDKESARVGLVASQSFEDIFYSESLDDCLYVVHVSLYLNSSVMEKMNIKSATTDSLYHNFDWPNQKDEFRQLINNLKK